MRLIRPIQVIASAALLILSNSAAAAPSCDFDCTLKQHLDAIQAKDFEQFAATITEEAVVDFILPNGRAFTSRDEYLELLKGWFGESGWHFNYEIIRTIKSPELGIALLKVSYDEDDRGGQPYHIDHFLNLSFQLQDNSWRLVLDQNTS